MAQSFSLSIFTCWKKGSIINKNLFKYTCLLIIKKEHIEVTVILITQKGFITFYCYFIKNNASFANNILIYCYFLVFFF
jgi:hypothetical protein